MHFEFKDSFERSVKRLNPQIKEQVKQTTGKVIDFYETGKKTPGLGIKQLRDGYWEARSGIRNRLLFRKGTALIEFILAGDHEDIKRFLKHEV